MEKSRLHPGKGHGAEPHICVYAKAHATGHKTQNSMPILLSKLSKSNLYPSLNSQLSNLKK